MEKRNWFAGAALLLAAALWAVTLLAVVAAQPTSTVQPEQTATTFREVISDRPAQVIQGFDPVNVVSASDTINYYYGGEGSTPEDSSPTGQSSSVDTVSFEEAP